MSVSRTCKCGNEESVRFNFADPEAERKFHLQEFMCDECKDIEITSTGDPVVDKIIKRITQRSKAGQKKYGQTMMTEIENNEKALADFVIDVQEEMFDAILYLESVKECLAKAGMKPNRKLS